jgi:ice-binding like protein
MPLAARMGDYENNQQRIVTIEEVNLHVRKPLSNEALTHVRPRVAAGILVALALFTAACTDNSAPSISAPALAVRSSSSQSSAPSLGSASNFAILSAAPGGGGAVTCTNTPPPTTITGDVGSSGGPASVVNTTGCTINGAIIAPVTAQVVADFNGAYAALAGESCDAFLTGTLAGVTLTPGVYCFAAAATLTGTLTLNGGAGDTWLFKVGTSGTGALTGTDFSVVMTGGADPCNVTWWVAEAATMTTSNFIGTILAGAGITVTSGGVGTFHGRALARGAVTITGGTFTGCTGGSLPGGGKAKAKCNQGVGNGPEGCDPGNSNQGDPSRSNDERGGIPGNPGRKGGR